MRGEPSYFGQQTVRLLSILVVHQCIAWAEVQAVKPYHMETVYIDKLGGSTCKPHEFTKIQGRGGYIVSHDERSLPTYKAGQQCFLIVEVPENYQISVQAIRFELGYEKVGDKCNGDSLFLFDNQPEDGKIFDSNLDMLKEFCTTVPDSTAAPFQLATSSNNSITLYWHAAELDLRRPTSWGFRLRWFAMKKTVRRRPDNRPVPCNLDSDFMCSNEQACIPLELACDKEMHCSDASDLIKKRQLSAGCENIEADFFLIGELSAGAVVALALAAAVFTLLIAGLITRCWCGSKNRRHHRNRCPTTNCASSSDNGSHCSSAFIKPGCGPAVGANPRLRTSYQSAPIAAPAAVGESKGVANCNNQYWNVVNPAAAAAAHTVADGARPVIVGHADSSLASSRAGSQPAPPPPSDVVAASKMPLPPPTSWQNGDFTTKSSMHNFGPPPNNAAPQATSPLTAQNLHNFNTCSKGYAIDYPTQGTYGNHILIDNYYGLEPGGTTVDTSQSHHNYQAPTNHAYRGNNSKAKRYTNAGHQKQQMHYDGHVIKDFV